MPEQLRNKTTPWKTKIIKNKNKNSPAQTGNRQRNNEEQPFTRCDGVYSDTNRKFPFEPDFYTNFTTELKHDYHDLSLLFSLQLKRGGF